MFFFTTFVRFFVFNNLRVDVFISLLLNINGAPPATLPPSNDFGFFIFFLKIFFLDCFAISFFLPVLNIILFGLFFDTFLVFLFFFCFFGDFLVGLGFGLGFGFGFGFGLGLGLGLGFGLGFGFGFGFGFGLGFGFGFGFGFGLILTLGSLPYILFKFLLDTFFLFFLFFALLIIVSVLDDWFVLSPRVEDDWFVLTPRVEDDWFVLTPRVEDDFFNNFFFTFGVLIFFITDLIFLDIEDVLFDFFLIYLEVSSSNLVILIDGFLKSSKIFVEKENLLLIYTIIYIKIIILLSIIMFLV